jgi:N-acetylmuramic acid 6-phosphate etherase
MPEYPQSCRLSHHSLLKILLNNASTLIMGRMDRYFSNIMTYVKPTNYKLIDRASRYVMILRPEFSYEQSVRMLYKIKPQLGPEEPVVLRIIHELESQKG